MGSTNAKHATPRLNSCIGTGQPCQHPCNLIHQASHEQAVADRDRPQLKAVCPPEAALQAACHS